MSIDQLKGALSGRYEVERQIGEGGMATVYLARDVRHDRRVALKLLKPELGAVLGAERFLSEIRVTASLQHPNLLPLFDSGDAEGMLFYVMPYVEGESLRARLDRETQLPIDEAVRIATAVASALDYAHRRGVVHRDLKPENILLHEGQPLVADFGIALAVSNAGGARVTQTGLSLGTPQYMSPEQAAGDRAVDGRTDVYSLGAVTYEMLAGEPPHTGATAQAIIARLLTEEPRPLSVVRRAVPPHVDDAVACALEKLPADRFATARQFAEALEGSVAAPAAATRAARAAASNRSRPMQGTHVARAATGVALVALAALAVAGWWKASRTPAAPSVRFAIREPATRPIADAGGNFVAVSPDGRAIAYLVRDEGERRLAVRRLDELEPRIYPGTDKALDPRFSADGRSVVLYASPDNRPGLYRQALSGGAPVLLTEAAWEGIAWGNSDSIVFALADTIRLIAGAGRGVTRLFSADRAAGETRLFDPYVFPGGRVIAYRAMLRDSTGAYLVARNLDGSGRRLLVRGENVLAYVDGWMYYSRDDGTVAAVRFDPGSREVRGEPVPLLTDVGTRSAGVAAAISPAGTLAYVAGHGSSILRVLDLRGTTLGETTEHANVSAPRWSPDGTRVAFVVGPEGALQGNDVWVLDTRTGVSTRLTTRGGLRPSWSPDGRRIAYLAPDARDSLQVYTIPADGSAPEELVVRGHFREVDFTPDGRQLVLRVDRTASNRDLLLVDLAGDRTPRPLLATNFNELRGTVSPDGKWLAYQSDESGRYEVYLRPFRAPGGRLRVSVAGGSEPLWAPDGRSLFYRTPTALMRARLLPGGELPSVLTPDSLFAARFFLAITTQRSYDVHPDGQRFIVATPREEERSIVVVTDWLRQAREQLDGR